MTRLQYLFLLILAISGCWRDKPDVHISSEPVICPDYKGITMPPNIAPPNFRIVGKAESCYIRITGKSSGFEFSVRGNEVVIPEKKWKNLIGANKGGTITFFIRTRVDREYKEFDPFTITISDEPADDYIVYRLIMPGFQNWNRMGIYQRSISSFRTKTVADSRALPGTCMNCHSFAGNDPSNMVFHLRESYGGTMLWRNNRLEKLNTKSGNMFANGAFPSWHVSGNYIAFSVNRVNQVFHAAGPIRASAVDMRSDIYIYDIEKNRMTTSTALSSKGIFETFPCFSADGKTLYYCSADSIQLPQKFNKVMYSLCAVPFDAMTGIPGEIADTIISQVAAGKSISQPRVSPDGNSLLFVMADYGCFPSYNPEADLWLMNLKSGTYKTMDPLNSRSVESWHSWSSNGRWIAFSSRRQNGLHSNIYLAYIDKSGNASKPFLLPQKDPALYDGFLYSFNVPEFAKSPVPVNIYEIARIARGTPATQVGAETGH